MSLTETQNAADCVVKIKSESDFGGHFALLYVSDASGGYNLNLAIYNQKGRKTLNDAPAFMFLEEHLLEAVDLAGATVFYGPPPEYLPGLVGKE